MFPKAVINAATPTAPVIDLDDDRLEEAQHLFAAYGTEIGGALILAALPQSYATAWGSRVLWANSRLQHDLVRRIKGTARFVLAVAQRGDGAQGRLWDPTWEPVTDGLAAHPHPPWQQCVELRLYHQAIRERLIDERERERVGLAARRKARPADGGEVDDDLFKSDVDPLGEHNEVPLNQEDLLGMLLSLSITTFEVLERYGISWTADQQESYLHMWDVVGAYLGIGVAPVVDELAKRMAKVPGRPGQPPLPPELSWVGLRPVGVNDTRRLLGQLRDRQWLELGPFANDDGPEVLPWAGPDQGAGGRAQPRHAPRHAAAAAGGDAGVVAGHRPPPPQPRRRGRPDAHDRAAAAAASRRRPVHPRQRPQPVRRAHPPRPRQRRQRAGDHPLPARRGLRDPRPRECAAAVSGGGSAEGTTVETMTVMITDIENSTWLWEHHTDDMAIVIPDHHRLMTSAIGTTGTLVKSTGDGVLAVFADPSAAVACAVDVQRAVAGPRVDGHRAARRARRDPHRAVLADRR